MHLCAIGKEQTKPGTSFRSRLIYEQLSETIGGLASRQSLFLLRVEGGLETCLFERHSWHLMGILLFGYCRLLLHAPLDSISRPRVYPGNLIDANASSGAPPVSLSPGFSTHDAQVSCPPESSQARDNMLRLD